MSEIELTDAILRTALELQRLSAHEETMAVETFRELEKELRQLLATTDLEAATKRELEALIKEANQAINANYSVIAGQVDTRGIMLTIAQKTVDVLDTYANAQMPSRELLDSLGKDVLIDGAPSSAWWAKQADDLGDVKIGMFAREVRQGVINGETTERIVQRIFGFDGEPGILDKPRRDIRTLVHSSIMTAANRARLETYRKNMKYAAGVRVLETLDTRTCAQCMAYDGAAWDFDGNPLEGTTLEFRLPQYHFGCRGVVAPIPKGIDEIFGTTGLDAKLQSPVRASKDGPTTATTMDAFLRRQPADVVEEMLGKGRADLWRRGVITLRDLVSGTGRELTLDELRAR